MSVIVTDKEELSDIINNAVQEGVASALAKLKPERLIDKHEAAALRQCSSSTIDKRVREGKLINRNPNGYPRFYESDILAMK